MPSSVSMRSEQVSTILLGHDISKEVIAVYSSRVRAVKVWPDSMINHFILLFRVSQFTKILVVFFLAESDQQSNGTAEIYMAGRAEDI